MYLSGAVYTAVIAYDCNSRKPALLSISTFGPETREK